ncbi:MAG: PEGA domain-containing protein [Candidatus Omnitrophica bacterium]|nr:PEGA domain-containing protein [Candidatus Omnitrophota bacterium]
MPTLRKLFFYLFTAIYLALCPLLILYALGYLFKPGAEHSVVKTGLLSLSSTPEGASVFVGKTLYPEKTPTIIRDLLPGAYSLTLAFNGYKPWTRTVPLEAGKSTALERILLLPREWKPHPVLSGSFEEIIPMPGNRFLLLKKGPWGEDHFVFDMETLTHWPLFPADSPLRGRRVSALHTVEGSPFILLSLDSGEGKAFAWIDPREKEPLVEDLSGLFPERPDRVQWDPHERRYLFTLQGRHLNRLDIDSRVCTPRFLEQIRGFGLFHQTIYALREDGAFLEVDEEGKKKEVLPDETAATEDLFGGGGSFRVEVLRGEIILFLGERGELLANRLPHRFVEKGVRGFEFDPHQERLLLWQKGAIGILDFSRKEPERGPFERGPKLLWVYRKGRDIRQAFWAHEGSHLLFRDNDRVFLLEVETRGKPRLAHLFRVKAGGPVVYWEAEGRLYYLEGSDNRLCSAEIVPRRNLLLQ